MDNLDQELGGLPLPTKNVGVDVKESLDSEGLPVPKKKVGTSKSSDLTSQSTSDIGWKNKIKEIKSNLGTSEPTTRFNEPTMQKYVPTSPELAEAVGVEPKKELYQTQNPELAKAIGTEPIKQKQTLVIGKETPIKYSPNAKHVKSPAQILKEEQDFKNEAINNTIAIKKKLAPIGFGIESEDKEKKDIEYKLANGEYELGNDPKTGKPTVMRVTDQGFFNTLWDTYNKNNYKTLEDQAFIKLPKQQAINQLNFELEQEDTNAGAEYLPYKNKGILPWLGEKTAEIGAPLLKAGAYGIGALTGAGRAAGGLETATAAALRASRASQAGNVLSFIQDMGFSGYTDNLKRTYKDLKRQNPQMSDEEAFDKAQNAGYFGEVAGIGAGAAMGGTFSKLKDAVTKVEVQPFINSLKHLGGEGLKQGGYASLSSLLTDIGAKSQGYRISNKDILENSINRGVDMAALTYVLGGTGLAAKEIIQSKHTAAAVQAMGIVSGAIKVPKPIIAQAKQVVSQLPLDEVQKIYQTAEDNGVLPQGSTEKAMTGLNNFNKTELQVPEGLSDELKASLKGIQEKINNLEESKSKLDKTYHPYMDEQIQKERDKAKKILETGDVFKNEVDDLGNPIENPKKSLEEKDLTVGEILDKRGTYNEENGQFLQDGQTVIFKPDNSNKIYEIGNVDEINDMPISKFGIKHEESVVSVNDNGNLEIRGKEYINNYSDPLQAINKDKEGNVVSVNLETPMGQKRTFRGNIAEDLAYQITLGKNAKVEELPIAPEVQKPITIGFAPFREKNVLDINQDQEIRNLPDYQLHQENLQKLAKGLGIPIVNKADTWGGYVDSETGRPVQEVSNVMQIEAKPDEARLMAAILGKAAPEMQDSVLVGHYDDNGGGFEHTIKTGNFENAQKALNLLKENNIQYFTVDKNNGDIIILDLDDSNAENIINFVKQLNNNGITTEYEYQPINGEFVEQKDYDSIIAGNRGKERKQDGFNIDAFIQEASGKYQEIKAQAEKTKEFKSVADKIRGLKITFDKDVLQSNVAGVPIAVYNLAVESIAKAVEAGVYLSKAIKDAIKEYNLNKNKDFNSDEFYDYILNKISSEKAKVNPVFFENSKEFANKSEFDNKIQFKKALQNLLKNHLQDLKKIYGKDFNPSIYDEKTKKYLSDVLTEEAFNAVSKHPEAIGWYDEKTQSALDVISTMHPEIAKDKESRGAFILPLAVMSNGNKVDFNFELAEKQYKYFKENGRFDTEGEFGAQQSGIKKSLMLVNSLLDNGLNMKDINEFLTSKYKAKDLKVKIDGKDKNFASGELADEPVYGATILGSKIGNGFYMNLWGQFDQLTMDRWFMRTWGRLTGTLIKSDPEVISKNKERLKNALENVKSNPKSLSILKEAVGKTSDLSIIDLANIIEKKSADKKLRSLLESDSNTKELKLSANSLAKNARGEKEAPSNGSERKYIREVFEDVKQRLKKEKNIDISMADLQAAMWYPEKILYESFKKDESFEEASEGYTEDSAPDYLNAAKKIAKNNGITDEQINQTISAGRRGISGIEGKSDTRSSETISENNKKFLEGFKSAIGEVKPTSKEKVKEIVANVRKAKIDLSKLSDGGPQSNILGLPVALYNAAVETIARAIEAGASVTDAILEAIEKHQLGKIDQFNKSEFIKNISDITGEKIEIKEPEEEVKITAEAAPRLVAGVSHKALQDIAKNLGLPEIERGTGLTPKEYAERGRAFINNGVNPEDVAAQFKITKKANADDISIVRAHAEDLLKAADDARTKFGENSKEFKEAKRIYDNWTRNVVKPMGTAAGQSFTALQGGTDIDTGSFVQMQSAVEEKTGKPLTEEQKLQIEKLTTDNKNLTTKLKDLTKKLTEVINKAVYEEAPVETKEVGKVKEEFKKVARFIRMGKLSRPDIFSSATPASLVWDGALEVAAKTVEVSGDIAQAIADGVEHIKNSDWYKNLTSSQQKDAQKAFVDYVKENSVDKTAKRIERLEAELDDLRNRREKETKNKPSVEKTQRELDLEDQIKSEKRVIKLEAELQDIIDGKEKEKTTKQKREKSQRELDLEAKIEKAKFDNFTKRFVDKKDSNFDIQDVRDIWNYAKSQYLDKDASFEEMLSGVAKDLGLSTKQVRDAITQPKQAKAVSDEMYNTISQRKAAIAQAKKYIETAGQSKTAGFFKSIPNFFFKLKTAGHGTVGGITHAGMNLFQPSQYKTYFPFFVKQFSYAFGKVADYEKAMEDLKNDPSFSFWKKAGLAVDPSEKYDDYQGEFIKQNWFDKLGAVGNRGFNALKVYRLELAKSFYDGLSESEKADPDTAKEIAKLVNHATGTSEVSTPKWTSTVFFAPKLEVSRWQGLIGDPVKATKTFLDWNNATPAERAMAKRVAKNAGEKLATYAALLAVNAGILAATGSKDKVNFDDPSKSDFLAFKIAGKSINPTGGMLATLRFIYTMLNSAKTAYTGTKKELRKKPQETQFQTIGTQLRYKLSPFASTAMDVFTGTDAMGRPLPWSHVKPKKGEEPYTIPGYLAQQQTPIPVSEALHEIKSSMKEKGMSNAQTNDILKGIAVGLISGGTGIKVQDVPKEKKRY